MKRFIKYLILFGGLALIISLSKNILRLLKASEEIKITEQKFQELKQNNQELKAQLHYYQSDEFVEQEARNKLNMSRPNEVVIVLPFNPSEKLHRPDHHDPPNWQKWWQLFFP